MAPNGIFNHLTATSLCKLIPSHTPHYQYFRSFRRIRLTCVRYNKFGQVLWTANTGGRQPCTYSNKCNVAFQKDGNLVEYYNGNAIWSSNTGGGLGYQLYFQDTFPLMYITNGAGAVVWHT